MTESHQPAELAGSGPDSPRIVCAKPTRASRPQVVVVLMAVAMALALAVTNDGTVRWVMAPVLVAGPLLGLLLRRRVVGSRPDRLEIRRDRITALVSSRGDARELSRADGDLLVVRGASAAPYLSVLGPAGYTGNLDMSRFDVGEVGQAALDHGWAWQPPGSTTAIQPPAGWAATAEAPPADSAEAVVIQLRDGRTRTVPKASFLPLLALGPVIVFGAVMFSVLDAALPSWALPVAVVGAVVVSVAGMLGMAFLLVRLSRATVTIGRDRLAVRYGSLSANLVQRAAIASGVAGKRWARLRNHHGKQLIWVPLRPKRDEVLAALWAYGWPVRDDD